MITDFVRCDFTVSPGGQAREDVKPGAKLQRGNQGCLDLRVFAPLLLRGSAIDAHCPALTDRLVVP